MDNFLGTPFDPDVKKQVEVRQESLGKYTNIPSRDIQAYNTKTPFLRLASSVNLEFYRDDKGEFEGIPKQLQQLGYPVDTWDQDYLAKNIILQGGVAAVEDQPFTSTFDGSPFAGGFKGLNKGLNNSAEEIFNGAYGWGGTKERGYIPMPGITTADVTYYSNGALAKANINIKCFSKSQFQFIDILYLRPGFSLLLEFGHSVWLDNNKDLQSMENFITQPMSKLLTSDGVNQYQMYRAIEEARKEYNYNYEAFFGKVSNFNWNFNSDGSYDCNVQLTSVGDVIQSLKCNITDPTITVETDKRSFIAKLFTSDPDPTQQPPLVANANKTVINRELYGMFETAQGSKPKANLVDYTVERMLGVDEDGNPTEAKDLTFKKSLLAINGPVTDLEENQSPQVYIKYGAFLAYLQSKVLLYDKQKDTPYIVFDMDFNDLDNDENVILKIPGQFSADPRVCLIPYDSQSLLTIPFVKWSDSMPVMEFPQTPINVACLETTWNYQEYLGRIGQILVNVNFLAASLETGEDDRGNINLIDYLKIVNAGIMKALGNVNDFQIKLSDDGGKIIFNENIPQRRTPEIPQGEFTRFNVYGVKPGVEGSFITNVNLNASIPSNFASMISIGAQSNGNQISENATSFSNYNKGIFDRIIEVKESVYPEAKIVQGEFKNDGASVESNFNQNINPKKNSLFKLIYEDMKFLSDNVNALVNHNKTHANLIVGNLARSNYIPSPFFLPFNFSLTMDGLSGMKLYQKFLMTDDILPPTYANDGVDLQITGINHKIDTTSWTTNLDTQSVAAEKQEAAARPEQTQSEATQQNSSNDQSGEELYENPAPPSLNPTSPTRREAMEQSYNYVFGRDGEVASMCARYSYNLALNYVQFFNDTSPIPRQLAAGGNANNNQEYYNNLTALGYSKTKSIVTKAQLLNSLATRTWGYGDIVAYYCNDGPKDASHVKYGHTQVYVGNINSVGWTTSKKTNYNTDFPYRSREGNNWTYLIFIAP